MEIKSHVLECFSRICSSYDSAVYSWIFYQNLEVQNTYEDSGTKKLLKIVTGVTACLSKKYCQSTEDSESEEIHAFVCL